MASKNKTLRKKQNGLWSKVSTKASNKGLVVAGILGSLVGIYVVFAAFAGTTTNTGLPKNAGIWMVWAKPTELMPAMQQTFVKGGQVKVDWATIQPTNTGGASDFDWTPLDNAVAPYLDPSIKKPFTIQVNSNKKPAGSWFYSSNVAHCGTYGPKANPELSFDVPQFWDSSAADGINPTFMGYETRMLQSLATKLGGSSYKSNILGVRTAPNLIGTEQSNYKSSKITVSNSAPVCNQTNWQPIWGTNAYAKIMGLYKSTFAGSGIKQIYRGAYAGLAEAAGGMFFNTSANPDDPKEYNDYGEEVIVKNYYDKARNGKATPYYEPYQESSTFSNPISWNWWMILQNLDRGVPYIAVYAPDILKAAGETAVCPSNIMNWTGSEAREYKAAYCFANKYAPYANNQQNGTVSNAAKAKITPGAWIVFTRNEFSHKSTGYLSMYMNGSNLTGTSDQYTGSNSTQRFGRYGRTVSGSSQLLNLKLDPNFKASLPDKVTINVTYLDLGTDSWTAKWGTGAGQSASVKKTNSGIWKTKVLNVTGLKSSSLLSLSSTGPTTFHMLEVERKVETPN